jgi:hypothetical protein
MMICRFINSSPSIDIANGIVYVGANDGVMHAIDLTTGKMRFQIPTHCTAYGKNFVFSSAAISDAGNVYFSCNTGTGRRRRLEEKVGDTPGVGIAYSIDPAKHFALMSPSVDCSSLASASLGPNISILSATLTPQSGATTFVSNDGAAPTTCTFTNNQDHGDPSTIITHLKTVTSKNECCAQCYAEPKCKIAALLPASYGANVGCWLKTGAGSAEAKEGVVSCKTTRPLPPAPKPYCLVKVLVQPAINIWVGLPADGSYNGRFMSLGGGGFVGSVSAPTAAVVLGYVGATTDTGHTGGSGSFGMKEPGVADMDLRTDFGWRSEHMMAGKSRRHAILSLSLLFLAHPLT